MTQNSRREIPQFNTPIVETHCHLDYLDSQTLSETLDDAFRVGIERVVTISVSADNLDQVRELANGHPSIWCTQGIHPHEAESWCPALAKRVENGAGDERVVAIGEIGLDYYYDHADRETQKTAFDAQLALAAELSLPVVIHTREADE